MTEFSLKLDQEWIGLCEYGKACTIQEQLVKDVLDSAKPIVLGFEHPTVITQGLRGTARDLRHEQDAKSDAISESPKAVPSSVSGIPVYWMRRGGGATLHSPGQLVIYPIVPIQNLGLGVKDFVFALEAAMIGLLAQHNVKAMRMEGRPGVFTDQGKIGFVGLQVHRGVTFHGIALNVSNDLGLFSKIISCGVDAQPMDSFKNHGVDKDLKQLFETWVDIFIAQMNAV